METKTSGFIHLIKKNDQVPVHRKLPSGKNPLSYRYESLSDPKTLSHLRPFQIHFQPKIKEEIPLVSHEGEEFIYLLEGQVEFRTTERKILLDAGDSLHFDAKTPHAFHNTGKKVATALAIVFEP